jgi:hypothetical protein
MGGGKRAPFGPHATQGAGVTRLLLTSTVIPRVAHVEKSCEAIVSVPAERVDWRRRSGDPATERAADA